MKTEIGIGVIILIAMIVIIGFIFVLPQTLKIARAQDVELVGLSDGQVLTYNSTSGNWTNQYVNGMVSSMSLENLTDVLITGIQNNQIIQYNSTLEKWENVDNPSGSTWAISNLTDISLVGLSNGEILRYNEATLLWENSDETTWHISTLADVSLNDLSDLQILQYNVTSSMWENKAISTQTLVGLTDVYINTPSDNNLLVYNSTSGLWENHVIPSHSHVRIDISDFWSTPFWSNIPDKPTTFMPSSHTHDTVDIISGIFDVARIPNLSLSSSNISDWQSAMDWTYIQNKPSTFTPSSHSHAASDVISGIFDVARIPTLSLSHSNISDWTTAMDWTYIQNVPSTFTPSSHTHGASDINSGVLDIARIPNLSLSHTNISDWNTAMEWSYIQNIPSTFTPSAHSHSASDVISGIFDAARIPNLSLSSSNITDWGTYINQAVLMTSTPKFGGLRIGSGTNGLNLGSSADDNFWLLTHTNTPNPNIVIGYGNGAGVLDTTREHIYLTTGQIMLVNGTITITDGKALQWSDTNLYRGSANVLKTDDAFTAVGDITGANIITAGNVDGVDVSALLIKTNKITDLGTIWDKTTKIAFGDTNFVNQSLLTTSSPTFLALTLTQTTGTAPLTVSSTTLVSNLNAQYWNGYQFSNYLDQAVKQASSPTFAGLTLNGALNFGADVNLYRYSQDYLKTNDVFIAAELFVGVDYNVNISPNQEIYFGNKVDTWDVRLYRSAANALKTDNAFHVLGVLRFGAGAAMLKSTAADNFLFITSTNTPNPNLIIGYGNGAGALDEAKENILLNAGAIYLRLGNVIITDGKAIQWSDVNLYRSAANVLKTDDALDISSNRADDVVLNVQNIYDGKHAILDLNNIDTANVGYTSFMRVSRRGTNMGEFGACVGDPTADYGIGLYAYSGKSIRMYVNGGTLGLSIDTTGKLIFGSGADTNLYRSAANVLRTDGKFQVGLGELYLLTDSGIIYFGSTADVNLYRSAANTLKTDDTFQAEGYKSADGSTGYTGTIDGITFKNGLAMAP